MRKFERRQRHSLPFGLLLAVISANPGATLNISGLGIPGTGILVDNTNAFTLTISATLGINNSRPGQTNSGNRPTGDVFVMLHGFAVNMRYPAH